MFKGFGAVKHGTAAVAAPDMWFIQLLVYRWIGLDPNYVVFLGLSLQEGKLVEKDTSMWQLQGEPTVLITLAHIFNYFSPLMVSFACPLPGSVTALARQSNAQLLLGSDCAMEEH